MSELERLKRIAETPQTVWTHQTIQGVPTSDVILSLVAMVEAAQEAASWQPIESAPKNQNVIVWIDGDWEVASYWAYAEKWVDDGCVPFSPQPTHYFPVPPPSGDVQT